jgi:hypothetical protein
LRKVAQQRVLEKGIKLKKSLASRHELTERIISVALTPFTTINGTIAEPFTRRTTEFLIISIKFTQKSSAFEANVLLIYIKASAKIYAGLKK